MSDVAAVFNTVKRYHSRTDNHLNRYAFIVKSSVLKDATAKIQKVGCVPSASTSLRLSNVFRFGKKT